MANVLNHKLSEWKRIRHETKRKLHDIVATLENAHRQHKATQQFNANSSLVADLVGLGGVLLSPFSGGLSLVATAASSGIGIHSLVSGLHSNGQLSDATKEALKCAESAMKEYDSITKQLFEISNTILNFETTTIYAEACDIVIKMSVFKYESLAINQMNSASCKARLQTDNLSNNNIPAAFARDLGNAINLTQSCTTEVIQFTRTTQRFVKQTTKCVEVLNAAKSVNEVSASLKSAQSLTYGLSLAATSPSQAHKLTYALQKACMASLENTASASSLLLRSVERSYLTAASTVKTGKETLNVVSNAQKTSRTTKSVRDVALGSDKIRRTTIVSKTFKHTSKVSGTVTKAASISKVGFALSAVAIPLDIYNIMTINDSMASTPEDVKKIKDLADTLGDDFEQCSVIIETFEQMHVEVYKVYKDYHIDTLYIFLAMCHNMFDLKRPNKYA